MSKKTASCLTTTQGLGPFARPGLECPRPSLVAGKAAAGPGPTADVEQAARLLRQRLLRPLERLGHHLVRLRFLVWSAWKRPLSCPLPLGPPGCSIARTVGQKLAGAGNVRLGGRDVRPEGVVCWAGSCSRKTVLLRRHIGSAGAALGRHCGNGQSHFSDPATRHPREVEQTHVCRHICSTSRAQTTQLAGHSLCHSCLVIRYHKQAYSCCSVALRGYSLSNTQGLLDVSQACAARPTCPALAPQPSRAHLRLQVVVSWADAPCIGACSNATAR